MKYHCVLQNFDKQFLNKDMENRDLCWLFFFKQYQTTTNNNSDICTMLCLYRGYFPDLHGLCAKIIHPGLMYRTVPVGICKSKSKYFVLKFSAPTAILKSSPVLYPKCPNQIGPIPGYSFGFSPGFEDKRTLGRIQARQFTLRRLVSRTVVRSVAYRA